MSATLRIERVVTRGTFALDGSTWDVDNNIWLIGDDIDFVIIDAALMHNRSSTWSPAER